MHASHLDTVLHAIQLVDKLLSRRNIIDSRENDGRLLYNLYRKSRKRSCVLLLLLFVHIDDRKFVVSQCP